MAMRLLSFLLFGSDVELNAKFHVLTAVLVKIYVHHSGNSDRLFRNVGTCLSI